MRRFLTILSVFLLLPAVAVAQQVSQDDESIRMQLGADLYIAGNLLTILAPVEDDLLIAGNQLRIRADVGGDVQAAGSSVTIDGNVAGDLRVLAGDVTVNGTIGGNVLALAGTIYIGPDATVAGNIAAWGGVVHVAGVVQGNVKVGGGEVSMTGTVGGAADVRGDTVTVRGTIERNAIVSGKNLTIDPAATFGGDLAYWTQDGERTVDASVAGTTRFDATIARTERTTDRGRFAGLLGFISLFSLFAAALAIGVFQLSTRTIFSDAAMRLRKAPGFSLLWGLIYFLLTPILAMFIMITIIGIPLAAAILMLYSITLLFAQVLTAMVLARGAERRWAVGKEKSWHPVGVFFAALGIWILLKLLWLVPIFGWAIAMLAIAAAVGALLWVTYERLWKVL